MPTRAHHPRTSRRSKAKRRTSAASVTRSRLPAHRILDELSDDEFQFAARFLSLLKQQTTDDDDTLTPEEEADLVEAYAELERGEGRPWSEVRKELGL